MAGGYILIGNENIKRLSYDSDSPNYSLYSWQDNFVYTINPMLTPPVINFNIPKVIILDAGYYITVNDDDETPIAMRYISSPLRLDLNADSGSSLTFISPIWKDSDDADCYVSLTVTPPEQMIGIKNNMPMFRGYIIEISVHGSTITPDIPD